MRDHTHTQYAIRNGYGESRPLALTLVHLHHVSRITFHDSEAYMTRKLRLVGVASVAIFLGTLLFGIFLGPEIVPVERVAAGGAPPPGSGPLTVQVGVRVYDGDTLEVRLGGTRAVIGLIGIEAPQG